MVVHSVKQDYARLAGIARAGAELFICPVVGKDWWRDEGEDPCLEACRLDESDADTSNRLSAPGERPLSGCRRVAGKGVFAFTFRHLCASVYQF